MSDTAVQETPSLGKRSFWLIIAAIAVGNFSASLSSTTVTIMLPVFMSVFHADIIQVQWTLTGYMLASGIVAPMIGYLSDRLSLKRTYILALTGFLITSFLLGFSWSVGSLIAFRILQGCFGGMLMPITMSLVYQVVPREKQAFALSIWSVSGVLAPTFGPTVAGLVTDAWGWQWVFFMNVPLILAAIIVARAVIPYYKIKETDEKQRFDYLGLVTGTFGTFCLLYVFSNFSKWGMNLASLLMLIAGAVCIIIFALTEFRVKNPMLYLKVLRYETFTWSLVVLTIASVCMNLSIVVLPIYLQDIMGYSTTISALIMLPGPLMIFFLVPLIGKYYDRLNAKLLLICCLSVGIVSMLMLHSLTLTTAGLFVLFTVVVRDLGLASLSMPCTNLGMTVIPTAYTSHAAAVNSWVRQCGSSFAIGLINTFLVLRTDQHIQKMTALDPLTDTASVYNACYVLSINDLALIGIGFILFGIFAVTRIKASR